MATSVIFKLKEPQATIPPGKQKETPVNLFFNYGYFITDLAGKRKYTPLKYATGEKIKPCYWKDRPIYRSKQVRGFSYDSFNAWLDHIEETVKEIYRNEKTSGRLPDPDQLRDLLARQLKSKPNLPDVKEVSLYDYLDRLVKEIEAGTRLNEKGEKYKSGTIRGLRSYRKLFKEFQDENGVKYRFSDVNKVFYSGFVNHFIEKKYSPNTVGRMVKTLKSIMRAAYDDGLHTSTETSKKYFKVTRTPGDEIYLTQGDLNKLMKHDLSFDHELEVIRDIFMVGVYTAQRFSDYSRIRKEDIKIIGSGVKVVELIQQKTSEKVTIPLKSELDIILKKYGYTLPRINDQKVNKLIKHIASLAKINDLVPVEKIKGGVKIKEDLPKHKLIKTHTARRTGATLFYLAGIPTLDIMKLTGHKTEREFLNYIKLSKEETAIKLARDSRFNNNLRIAK
jgi:integrase